MGKKSFGVSFSIHPNIKFSREAKQNMALPFLDVLVRKTTDGLLKYTVYRIPTQMDLYLHTRSKHNPSQKCSVLNTLTQQAKTVCDDDNLDVEINHLKKTFTFNV
jgi:hypothetical protein